MRQRITYLLPEGVEADPSKVEVGKSKLVFRAANLAGVEKRLTTSSSDIPASVHELHIRWASPRDYSPSSPLVSRIPPGLHVFYTPTQSSNEYAIQHRLDNKITDRYSSDICPLLKELIDKNLKCDSVAESFSRLPILSERFAASSTYQYFHALPKLLQFQAAFARKACDKDDTACIGRIATLSSASYFDIDYDTISNLVTLTGFWPASSQNGVSHQTVEKLHDQDTVEVGVLHSEKADEPEELKLGGHLTVLGDSEKPSGTLFSFPSRHHPLPDGSRATFSMAFQQPTGLHPKLDIKFPRKELTPPRDSCALHAYFTLPSALFIDRYQLSDPLFLASQNLVSLRSLSGEDDLEAPDWVVSRWGSAALLELAHPDTASGSSTDDWTVTIPTHLRYLSSTLSANDSSSPNDKVSLDIPWPNLFWACEAEEGLKMNTNPFDRVNLGYDGLFGPRTMFYHIPPQPTTGKQLIETLNVPVLDAAAADWVQMATLIAVSLGFAWICWKLLGGNAQSKEKSSQKPKKK